MAIGIPVPARGGAEVALGIYYKTFLIYRTCMESLNLRSHRSDFECFMSLMNLFLSGRCLRRQPSLKPQRQVTLLGSHRTRSTGLGMAKPITTMDATTSVEQRRKAIWHFVFAHVCRSQAQEGIWICT